MRVALTDPQSLKYDAIYGARGVVALIAQHLLKKFGPDGLENYIRELESQRAMDDYYLNCTQHFTSYPRLVAKGKKIAHVLRKCGIYPDLQRTILEYAFKDQEIAAELCPTQSSKRKT